jgi:hypothetical protein
VLRIHGGRVAPPLLRTRRQSDERGSRTGEQPAFAAQEPEHRHDRYRLIQAGQRNLMTVKQAVVFLDCVTVCAVIRSSSDPPIEGQEDRLLALRRAVRDPHRQGQKRGGTEEQREALCLTLPRWSCLLVPPKRALSICLSRGMRGTGTLDGWSPSSSFHHWRPCMPQGASNAQRVATVAGQKACRY